MAQNLYRQFQNFSILDIRVFISAFIALSVLAVLLLAWRARPQLQERMPVSLANVIVVGGVSVYLLLAVTTLAFLWEIVTTDLIVPGSGTWKRNRRSTFR
ncbi:hypothetical protein ACFFQF_01930 [Haladaptatus pallidirubidus]|uniref:hypothetical protein n=1 Tax=Haladaptatus pallidirubidus TaxID=1008152 RepID=UPI0035EA507C